MAGYHVGYGWAGIYAGTLNQKGDLWKNKSEVTTEALSSAALYLLTSEKEFHFERGGKKYVLLVEEES